MLNIKKADFRMRDVEILIRFFAFNFFAKEYSGSMQNFLDLTCDKLNKSFANSKSALDNAINVLNFAIDLTFELFGTNNAFRKFKSGKYEDKYNRAVIDIMLFYFSQISNKAHLLELQNDIKTSFELLCTTDQEFLSSLESTTKSLSAIHYRFRRWGEVLSEVTGEQLHIPDGY